MKMSDWFALPADEMDVMDVTGCNTEPPILHAINQHDKLVEAVRLFLAYNDATDDDDDVAMMLMYADALKAAREAIECESE